MTVAGVGPGRVTSCQQEAYRRGRPCFGNARRNHWTDIGGVAPGTTLRRSTQTGVVQAITAMR
jgi:hypothetical protein